MQNAVKRNWYRAIFWLAVPAPMVGALLCWPHLGPMDLPSAMDVRHLIIVPVWVLGTAVEILHIYFPWHFFGLISGLVVLGAALLRRDRVYSWGAALLSLLFAADFAFCWSGEGGGPACLQVVSLLAGR